MKRKQEVPVIYLYGIHAVLAVLLFALALQLAGGGGGSWAALFRHEPVVATIAHRGASGYAPENTLAAFRAGVRMDADYLEMDLQLTRDGEIVIMHDDTVNRTTDGKGKVKNMTLAQIRELDAGTWFNEKFPMYADEDFAGERVPTLREVFEAFGDDARYMLETKEPQDYPGMEEKLVELVQEYKLEKNVAVQSFSKTSLKKIRSLEEDIKLFQLIWYNGQAHISKARLKEIKSYADGIGPNFQKVTPGYIQRAKDAGLLVYAYTVNYQGNMNRAVDWGVDGIHTNYPDRFLDVLKKTEAGGGE